ncbi:MAG: UDP-N-acetylmuramoyl-tripeptide--D-alanyl-D-alanine ligase [Nocardioides sp.]|uniref:UDP-N-acetylmuramoyl-tripeptide--D-alanyl-D- alanine ligase n=1 Tax=Nocardioides sp. TaxID=35761 RepID=UPI0039E29A68
MTLTEIAEVTGGEVVGGEVVGDGAVAVSAPVVIDSREAVPGSLFAAFRGEHVDGHEYAVRAGARGAVAVIGTRPTELPTVVVADVQQALHRLAKQVVARVRERGDLTVIALTGSQGKTSTKDLIAAVLARVAPTVATHGSFNNELGMPLTALRVEQDTRFLVLEMGARARGHIAELTGLVAPDIAVVLNVGTAHLDGFGSREAIAEAKGELVEAVRPGGTAVLNADDDRVSAMSARTAERVLTFGHVGPGRVADVRVDALSLDRLGRPGFDLVTADATVPVRLRLVGAHQATNAAAAAGALLAAGLAAPQIGEALGAITSLSHWRMELHELPGGVIVLNDAYNANPESMRAAIDALAVLGRAREVSRTIAVLGEMRELGETAYDEHVALGRYLVERGVDLVVVVGEPTRGIVDGVGPEAVFVPDNAAAVAWLEEHLGEGDAVLIKASNGARLFEVADALT